MTQDESCCRVYSRGLYSCRWRRSNNNRNRAAGCWFSVVTLVSLLSLCWMYICLVTFNDQDDVNWEGFKILKRWVNWFMLLIIISAVLTSYCVLLLVFALFQVALQEPLNLHWLHKIFLFFGVTFIAFGVTGISFKWKQEWPTVPLSLLAIGPFLQFGAVGALTLLSPFVFRALDIAKKQCSKFLITVVFIAVSAVIFLCPPFIKSPCLIEKYALREKPKLIGHRGAPMLAPENTMMSFNRSIACGVTAFETDVQLRPWVKQQNGESFLYATCKDRVPFLMHDHESEFLRRTTDVKEKFPDKYFNHSANLTWAELQSLNAGEWFLKTDPFLSVSKLSKEEMETARNQSIPSLLQLLNLAKQHNISVLFDLYSPDIENDTEDTVNTILSSDIDPRLVLWLPTGKREYVKKNAPGFIQVYNDSDMLMENNGSYLNVKYSKLKMEEIRKLREKNITVNLWVVNERWLFSLLWCAGASSVTTNSCDLLKDMDEPDWLIGLERYRTIWIIVDVASILIMTGLYVFRWRKQCVCHREAMEPLEDKECPGEPLMYGSYTKKRSTSAWDEKELSCFLPTG